MQTAHRNYYAVNADKHEEASKQAYDDPDKDMIRKAYANDPEKFKQFSKKSYTANPGNASKIIMLIIQKT